MGTEHFKKREGTVMLAGAKAHETEKARARGGTFTWIKRRAQQRTEKEAFGVGVGEDGFHAEPRVAVALRELTAVDVPRHLGGPAQRPHCDAHGAAQRHLSR